MKYSIDTLLQNAVLELKSADIGFDIKPRMESEILLSFILNVPRTYLHTHNTQNIKDSVVENYMKLVAMRKRGKPIEYITQNASFYGRNFYVNSSVLIPRPETEILIDKASELISTYHLKHIVEVGIGSGIITTTLALMHPQCHFFATDISKKALKVAKKNINTYAKNANITLSHSSILPPNAPPFDLLISNPPYIKNDYSINKSLCFEPSIALFGGEDGLDVYRAIFDRISSCHQIWILCEIGYDQKTPIATMLHNLQAQNIEFYKDLSGWDRGFCAYFL